MGSNVFLPTYAKKIFDLISVVGTYKPANFPILHDSEVGHTATFDHTFILFDRNFKSFIMGLYLKRPPLLLIPSVLFFANVHLRKPITNLAALIGMQCFYMASQLILYFNVL